MLDQKISSLDMRVKVKYNETYQETTSKLQEIKDQVTVIRESQEKMCRAIDGMGKTCLNWPKGMLVQMMVTLMN